MATTVAESVINDIIAVVARYVTVDGYYSRRKDINIRVNLEQSQPDWKQQLSRELAPLGYSLSVHVNGMTAHLQIYPGGKRFPWLNILLFVLTTISVSILPGLFSEGTRIFSESAVFLHWQKFAVPLLLILLFHEFGHYLAARRRGIRVSLPYFLPAPTIIGTFGAFIKSNSPFPSRRDLMEVGAYGPIAGFVVAVGVLAVALADVTYRLTPPIAEGGMLVEPLIMRLLEALIWTHPSPEGYNIYLQDNPLLFAAWVGMIVTALNLLPVGQLDGGHIVYSLSPRWHYWISRLMFGFMVAMGFMWEGWWIWAAMVFFVIRFAHPPTLNDFEPIDRRTRWTGFAALAIFVLTFSPVPF